MTGTVFSSQQASAPECAWRALPPGQVPQDRPQTSTPGFRSQPQVRAVTCSYDWQRTGGSHGPLLGLDEFAGAAHRTREDMDFLPGLLVCYKGHSGGARWRDVCGDGLSSGALSSPPFGIFGKASLHCPDGLNYWLLAIKSTSRGQRHWKFQPSNHTVGSTGDQPLCLSGVQKSAH